MPPSGRRSRIERDIIIEIVNRVFRNDRTLKWFGILILGVIFYCFYLFHYEAWQTLLLADNYGVLEVLVKFSHHFVLDSFSRQLLNPPYGFVLCALAYWARNPIWPMFAVSIATVLLYVFLAWRLARRWFGFGTAWVAAFFILAAPMTALYARWGIFQSLYALLGSIILMDSLDRFLSGKSQFCWAWAAGLVVLGLTPCAGLHANNIVLFPFAMVAAILWNRQWEKLIELRAWLWAVVPMGVIFTGLTLTSGLQGYDNWLGPVETVFTYLFGRGESFAGGIGLASAWTRSVAMSKAVLFDLHGYYNVWPSFDKTDAALLHPFWVFLMGFSLLRFLGPGSRHRRILWSFVLVPPITCAMIFDEAPRYLSVILPPASILAADAWMTLYSGPWPRVWRWFARVLLVAGLGWFLGDCAAQVRLNLQENSEWTSPRWQMPREGVGLAVDFIPMTEYREMIALQLSKKKELFNQKMLESRRHLPIYNHLLPVQIAMKALGGSHRRDREIYFFPNLTTVKAFNWLTDFRYARESFSIEDLMQPHQELPWLKELLRLGRLRQAFFFFNPRDPYGASWRPFHVNRPPDPTQYQLLPFAAARISVKNSRWSEPMHWPEKFVRRGSWIFVQEHLYNDKTTHFHAVANAPNGRQWLSYVFSVPRLADYRIWCLLKPSPDSSVIWSYVDQSGPWSVPSAASLYSPNTSFFWANLGDYRMKGGDHVLTWFVDAPGQQGVERCHVSCLTCPLPGSLLISR